jgi:hypothetical protein
MYIGMAAGAFSFAAYIPYALACVQGEQKPERASWAIWMLSNVLILLSYYALGARATIWVPLAYVLGSAMITALSFIYGKDGWGILRQLALVVAFVSAIRWLFFENIFLALVLNMSIDFIGYIPNLAKLWKNPKVQENVGTWALYFFGTVLNIAAISSWTLEIALLPVVLVIMNGLMFAFAVRNYWMQSREPEPPTTI